MKGRHISIFCALQGVLCCIAAHFFLNPILWLCSLVLLLPGSLLGWLQLFVRHSGTHWSLLMRGLMAIIANVLLFALAALLSGQRPKSN